MSSKLTLGDIRTHPARERLYQAIAERPGVTFLELVRATSTYSLGATSYHLYRLERAGLVHHVKAGRCVHYYVVGAVSPPPRRPPGRRDAPGDAAPGLRGGRAATRPGGSTSESS